MRHKPGGDFKKYKKNDIKEKVVVLTTLLLSIVLMVAFLDGFSIQCFY